MLQAIGRSYADAWTCVRALPLVVGFVVLVEGAQHVVEWSVGFYQNTDAARLAERNPVRLALGTLKVLSIVAVSYWISRFLLSPRPTRRIVAGNWASARRFACAILAYFLLGLLLLILAFSLNPLGFNQIFLLACAGLGGLILRAALSYWTVGAAVDDPNATFLMSLKLSRGHLLWGTALIIATYLPPLALHYLLGLGAVGKPPLISAVLLAVDCLVVGYVGAILASAQVQIARRVAAGGGRALTAPAIAAE